MLAPGHIPFYGVGRRGSAEVEAVVPAVDYLKDRELELAEQKMRDSLKRKVRLHVEQVKVLSQGLAVQDATFASAIAPARPAGRPSIKILVSALPERG